MAKIKKELVSAVAAYVSEYTDEELDEIVAKVKKLREKERKKNEDPLSAEELAAEVFKLCPDCTFIPLCVAWDNEDNHEYSIEQENLQEMIYDDEYIVRKLKKDGYILPHTEDSMTFGDWKKVVEYMGRLAKKLGLKNESVDGDYCEGYYVSLCGYLKNTGGPSWFYDINR